MQTSYPEICGILRGFFPTKSKTYINSEIISAYEVWIVIVTDTAQNQSQTPLAASQRSISSQSRDVFIEKLNIFTFE